MNEAVKRTIHVLIVDDDQNVREPLADWLRRQHGYQVETAENGEGAVALVKGMQGRLDAIIMDQELEWDKMNGIEAMRTIKAEYPAIQVVIITAYGEMTKGVEALKAGAYRYLMKPYDATEIAYIVQSIAELHHLEQQLQELNWLETVHAISSAVQGVFRLDEVLTRIQEQLRQVMNVSHCYIALYDEEQSELDFRVFVESGEIQQGFKRKWDPDGLSEQVIRDSKSLFIKDWAEEKRTARVPGRIVGDLHLHSFLISPLIARGRVVGVMSVQSAESGFFNEGDERIFSTVANQAASAIENAQLHEEREWRLNETRVLYDLATRLFQQHMEPEAIFEETVKSILNVSQAKAANMLLFNEIGELEELKVAFGELSERFRREIRARPDGMSAQILETGQPCIVSKPDDPPGLHPLLLEEGVQASIGLPLQTTKRIIGVMFVHYKHLHRFSPAEVNLLSLFASQAAVAIENATRQEELAAVKGVAWMGMVASNWAHRITQKSSAIRVTVDTLRTRLGDDPQFTRQLDRIDRCAVEIQQTPTGALIPYEDVEQLVSVNELLRREVPAWCADRLEVQVCWKLAPTDTKVRADQRWLAIALETLVSNALRAMQTTPRKVLTVASQVQQDKVFVEVADTGPGIPDRVAAQLFKRPVERSEGSGVGLLLSKTIVHRYGGDLRLLRTGSEETSFLLWLPLAWE